MQEEVIQSALEGHDSLALLPTGGGKSVCFQVPGMAMKGLCLVISPLIALMKDQVEQLKKKGIEAAAIYAGMPHRQIDIILGNCLYGKTKFLYVSPERLKTDLFLTRFETMHINLIAVDEAHCISQWGYDFRPPYLEIAAIRPVKPEVPVMALTATATADVVKDIQEKLAFKKENVFRKSFYRTNLSYSCFEESNKESKIREILKNVPGSSIIYVRSRKKTHELARTLHEQNINADFYHAGLSYAQRNEKQDNWIKNKARVIVATNAFGMGIDKPDVRTVIHYDLPQNLESYYQEAGRAGRDEKKSYAVVLYDKQDIELLREKTAAKYPDIGYLKKVYQAIANYFKVAVGTHLLSSFEFHIHDFCETFNFKSTDVFFAIKQLHQLGFLDFNESFYSPSQIHIPVGNKTLYEFQVANIKLDPLIKTLLRMYGGELFTIFIHISEHKIAKNLNTTAEQIKKALLFLHKNGIVEYHPLSDAPRITFLTTRYDANNLPVDKHNYQKKKNFELEKVAAVTDYVSNNRLCRSIQLLHYFDEHDAEKCNICDVCISTKKSAHTETLSEQTRNMVLDILKEEVLLPEELEGKITNIKKENLVKLVRNMLENGELTYTREGKLKAKD